MLDECKGVTQALKTVFVEDEQETLVVCRRCGQEKPADRRDKHLCVDCVKAENNRVAYLRRHQGDWMEIAKDAGIDVWLQQPGETQLEYAIWVAYRDSYPGAKPSYKGVAEKVGTTLNYVRGVAQRWTFQARMQAWMAECDRITLEQRHREILDMNADHVSMARRIREKMSVAIDNIDPYSLKPTELGSLMKIATDLERRARLDTIEQDEKFKGIFVDAENPNIKKSPTKQGDLAEVVNILLSAGALGSVTQIGVRETTTREIIAKDDDGNESRFVDNK